MKNRLSWNFLLDFDFSNPFPNFRSEYTLYLYKDFKEKNKNMSKFINEKYLKNKNYSIEKNDFPYLTEENLHHYVLWINKSFEKNVNKILITKILKNKMKELNFIDFIYFENHYSIKTIPDILHYQVFFLSD